MNIHVPGFFKTFSVDLAAILALAVAVFLFWFLVMGGAVLLFGPPHSG